jgi:hypothetical protein
MVELKCTKCGKVSETLPMHCGYTMTYNEETNAFECYMGPACGYIRLDEYVCENCCK